MKTINRWTKGITLSMALQALASFIMPPVTVFAAALSPAGSGGWALNDLMAVAVTALVALVAILVGLVHREDSSKALPILFPAAASIIVFLITQDMSGIMNQSDVWTVPLLVLEAVTVVLAVRLVMEVGDGSRTAYRKEASKENHK